MSITTSLYKVQIIVRNKPIQVYAHEGNAYVEGRDGSDFELLLENRSSKETLFIPSVDGLSIMDGKPADANSKGYVLKPYEKLSIPGWSLDTKSVAKFVFSSKKKSYAATHSDNASTENVGVIGCLVFSKKEKQSNFTINWNQPVKIQPIYPWYTPVYPYKVLETGPTWSKDTLYGSLKGNDPFIGSVTCSNTILRSSAVGSTQFTETMTTSASIQDNKLNNAIEEQSFTMGTAFGEQETFETTSVSFEKGELLETIVLYYDSRKNLEKMGIIIRNEHVNTKPNPFPGTGCKPPIGWNQS